VTLFGLLSKSSIVVATVLIVFHNNKKNNKHVTYVQIKVLYFNVNKNLIFYMQSHIINIHTI